MSRGWGHSGSSPACNRRIPRGAWISRCTQRWRGSGRRGCGTPISAAIWRRPGGQLAFASDWPVTDVSGLRGIGAALTRQPLAGAGDQRPGLLATLRAYTAGGAWAAHRDHVTGRLAVGMAADLVVLGADIETVAAAEIDSIPITLPLCGGRITHRAG